MLFYLQYLQKLSGNFNFQDMMIWETIGLWHYSIPGLFLLAQFCLGVFVALCNLVNNSVFFYLTPDEGPSSSNDHHIDGMCVIL
jgi:piezo-type mechanosensitive ion channel component 1/2